MIAFMKFSVNLKISVDFVLLCFLVGKKFVTKNMETTIFYDFGLMEKLFFFFLFSFLVNCLFSSLYSNGLASTSNS